MTVKININNVERKADFKLNLNNVWKKPTVWLNVNGTWKKISESEMLFVGEYLSNSWCKRILDTDYNQYSINTSIVGRFYHSLKESETLIFSNDMYKYNHTQTDRDFNIIKEIVTQGKSTQFFIEKGSRMYGVRLLSGGNIEIFNINNLNESISLTFYVSPGSQLFDRMEISPDKKYLYAFVVGNGNLNSWIYVYNIENIETNINNASFRGNVSFDAYKNPVIFKKDKDYVYIGTTTVNENGKYRQSVIKYSFDLSINYKTMIISTLNELYNLLYVDDSENVYHYTYSAGLTYTKHNNQGAVIYSKTLSNCSSHALTSEGILFAYSNINYSLYKIDLLTGNILQEYLNSSVLKSNDYQLSII